MKKLTNFIVDHCYVILAIVVALAGLSAVLATRVRINHDIMEYMPADSEIAQGLDIMDEEFSNVVTSSYILMFEDLDESKESEITEFLENTESVKKVEHNNSNEFVRTQDGTKYFLYRVTVNGEADSEVASTFYKTVHEYLDESKLTYYEKGDIASSNGEVLAFIIIVIAVVSALVIIWLMSDSNIEPFLYLAAILLAVLINKGTNIIFPNVSHITDSIAAILQMALSMDYSIMLASRYRQEREQEQDKRKAMKAALKDSFSAISSSSLTTIVGLIVLVAMSFTIGRDMGLVLSKGVLLSLLSIFTTLPGMLLLFDKPLQHSHKHAPKLKMDWLGKGSYFMRYASVPLFLFIFVAAALLKGNLNIEFTSSANDKIKDVFSETNQIAVVYDNADEAQVAKICHEYDVDDKVTSVTCYSNTIGEPRTYDTLVAKAEELDANLDIEDYLLRTIYYHYYNLEETHTITLPEFVNFVLDEVMPDDNFADDMTGSERRDVLRLSNFVTNKMYNEQSLSALATLIDMDQNALRDIMVLYGARVTKSTLGRQTSEIRFTLPQFVSFVQKSVLTNPTYAKSFSESAKSELNQLARFLDADKLKAPADAAGLSQIFGIAPEQVGQILNYATFLGATPTLTDEERMQVLGIMSSEKLSMQFQQAYQLYVMTGDLTIFTLASENVVNTVLTFSTQPEPLAPQSMSAVDFVSFVLAHAEDPMLAGQLDAQALGSLTKAQGIMQSVINGVTYDSAEIAKMLNIDASSARILYSYYNLNSVHTNPTLSAKALLNFLVSDIMPDESYSAKMSASQKSNLTTVAQLMKSAEANVAYTSKTLYQALSPLSQNLDSDLVDLLFIYHGSVKDYDLNWTMTLEEFVNFANDNILTDSRFERKIDDDKRQQAIDAKADIKDARNMLIGSKHSRALIETHLPEEGEETMNFVEKLRNAFDGRHLTSYLIGNSSMAYEMSKTFGNEMNFITILTMVAIFIVVALTFRSVLVPVILVVLIQSAVWATMAILSFTGTPVYFISLIIVQAILMGATIDYGILYTSYYLEHRKQGISVKQAVIDSYNKSIHAIITSAAVLTIVTLIVGNFAGSTAIASKICITISEGTVCSSILILLVLPAVLAACDKLIIRKQPKH